MMVIRFIGCFLLFFILSSNLLSQRSKGKLNVDSVYLERMIYNKSFKSGFFLIDIPWRLSDYYLSWNDPIHPDFHFFRNCLPIDWNEIAYWDSLSGQIIPPNFPISILRTYKPYLGPPSIEVLISPILDCNKRKIFYLGFRDLVFENTWYHVFELVENGDIIELP